MINGVKVKKIVRHHDESGYLCELVKEGEETFATVKQTNYTKAYPGFIKAFHWHKKQDDIWFPVAGNMQIVMYDRRPDSPTKGETQVICAGETNPLMIYIPVGVAHGYKVLGNEPAYLFYHTTNTYNPKDPDEMRIPYNDPEIGFNWDTKFE